MTDEVEMTRLDARTRRRHRNMIAGAVVAAIAALLLAFFAGAKLTQKAEVEEKKAEVQEQRAEEALAAYEIACRRLEAGELVCPIDPEKLRGFPGPIGPAGERGPGPTELQIMAAVNEFFRVNPPQPGRPPSASEIAIAVSNYLSANPPATGPPGERGPGPTAEQVADAVEDYLTENPPPAGPAGPGPTPEQIADAVQAYIEDNPLPLCPVGAHIEEYNPPLDGRTLIVCVKNEE